MGSSSPPRPLAVNDRALQRAATWLGRRGLSGVAPTPLLAARLNARRRSTAIVVALTVGPAVLFFLARPDALATSDDATRLTGYVLVLLAAVVVRWWGMRALRRTDRRLGASLARRVAHPTPAGWGEVLGRWRVAVGALIFGGALVLAASSTLFARAATDRTMSAILLLGVAGLGTASAVELVDILRRPALADDAMSLRVDDILRAEDARLVLTPAVPSILIFLTAAALSPAAHGWWLAFAWFGIVGAFLSFVVGYTPVRAGSGGQPTSATS